MLFQDPCYNYYTLQRKKPNRRSIAATPRPGTVSSDTTSRTNHFINMYEISDFHGGGNVDLGRLGCNATWT
jgi:hypothetical protein